MKKNIALLLFLALTFSQVLVAQEREDTLVFSEKYKKSVLKLSAIKSNLIFIDSAKLLSTFSNDKGIQEFIHNYKDSSFSFISNFKFDLVNRNLVLRKNKFNLNSYELAFYNYVKNNFKNLKFKEKRNTNSKYKIITDWMFYSAEKQIVITIMDFTKNQHVILFTTIIPYEG